MFNSSLDILYIVLAAVILLVGILLAIAIIYLIFILRDASKTSHYVRDTVKKVNDFVYRPLVMANSVMDKVAPILESIAHRGEEMAESAARKVKKRGRPRKKK
ncbi:hypothetical protein ACFL3C_00545 [Patescibacteria group bacterium]